ncbi:U3 small nucleolar RNA-associated protein [Mycena indigotica]|uniref:U3 small nucleolar RNA-associated protein n=1 Tax=Mycena indigotica TaxID=2126181 RepID=A0A8H6SXF3_9AGAR|nr:U3 small nucleolar RNA-associated protein [Mycena indigotica]KAF7307206.1 U3 small nucleolar RNA-associated protein [Mycena indigotica]
MASLDNILNPEQRRRTVKLLVNEPPPGWPEPSDAISDEDVEELGLEHIPHPDCPDSLACLPDTDDKPQHTLPIILRCAILGSPRQRLTIREIYAAMEEKYAYYRTAGQSWKQSVRHHLSLSRLFEHQPRPPSEPGVGSHWTVNLLAPPGTKRPRKRNRTKDGTPLPPPSTTMGATIIQETGLPKRANSCLVDEDDSMLSCEEEEDELESGTSECDTGGKILLHPFERRNSLSGRLTPYDASAGSRISPSSVRPHIPSTAPPLPPLPSLLNLSPHPQGMVERLQTEITNLRRQSAEAISLSMRLSDQLAQAEAEVLRTHSALEQTRLQLRDESIRRRQAEQNVDQAIRLRDLAEEALRDSLKFSGSDLTVRRQF